MNALRPRRLEHPAFGNRLLASLSESEQARIAPHLVRVPLKLKKVLFHQGQPIDGVYFPESGAISLVYATDKGKSVEVGLIGNEGVVGVHAVFASATPFDALVQVQGEAWLLRTEDLRHESRDGGILVGLLLRYSHAFLIQTMQTAACNKLHSIRQRIVRWILMMHDRAKADKFPLTHESVAAMLGVRRSGITVVARTLQRAGFISYQHGQILIRDRAKLEAASCECYKVVQEHFGRLFPSSSSQTDDDAALASSSRMRSQPLRLIPFFI
jgi:CRP-like cAMP-binding protein